jgi:hypothetical protein
MVRTARIGPTSGPESNSTAILSVPDICDWGTRTEAGQKVPQANPECAVAIAWPLLLCRATRAPRVSCMAGDAGEPR